MKTAVVRAAVCCFAIQFALASPASAALLAIGPSSPDRRTVTRFDPATGTRLGSFSADVESLYGLCLGRDGVVYATANTLGRGEILAASVAGEVLGRFGTTNLHTPTGIAVDESGVLYVAAGTSASIAGLWQVLRFDTQGEFLGTIVPARPEYTNQWTTLALDPQGHLNVCDSGRGILRFDKTTGEFLKVVVANGSGGLRRPSSFVYGPDGKVYVACRDSGLILRYDAGTGEHLRGFEARATEPGALAFGPDGNLYVAGPNGIRRHEPNTGEDRGQVAPAQSRPSSPALLFVPDTPALHIAIERDGVVVSWPETGGQWELLSKPAEQSGIWSPVVQAPIKLQSRNVVKLPLNSGTALFRLRQRRFTPR